MINPILKGFVDLIYGTRRVRKQFEQEHPNEKILAADASKGIVTTSDQAVQRGPNWATAQREVLLLTDKRIVCGNWSIPLDTISKTQLVKINSIFGGGYVLKVQTIFHKNYQFGMQVNPEWVHQNVLTYTS